MSGGYFDYEQYRMGRIADEIENLLPKEDNLNTEKNDDDFEFSEEIQDIFKEAIKVIRKAYIYSNRIDYFLSGDDGEESFLERLKLELRTIEKT